MPASRLASKLSSRRASSSRPIGRSSLLAGDPVLEVLVFSEGEEKRLVDDVLLCAVDEDGVEF